MNRIEPTYDRTVVHMGFGDFSLQQVEIEGQSVKIRAGNASFECQLAEGPWVIEAPLGARWATFSVLDQAYQVQGEGKVSMKMAPAKRDDWISRSITLRNVQGDYVGRLDFSFLIRYDYFEKCDDTAEREKPPIKMTPYKLEAADFEGMNLGMWEGQMELLLGHAVPEFPDADRFTIEELQRMGFKDLREYHVASYLANIM